MEEPAMSTLEKRIASALVDNITSTVLSALIAETEAAITQAAEAERAKALDPIVSPDPVKAYAAMDDAAFTRERLRNVLTRLQARYQEIAALEYLTKWKADYEVLKVERDALAAELSELYPTFASRVADLLTRIAANDVELSHLHRARPSGVSLHLLGAELVARNLEKFGIANPSISKGLQLPNFDHSDRMAWPPRRTFDSAVFSAVSAPRRFSADWGVAAEEEARALSERRKREAADEEAEAHANWRGPRWWKGERV
jgi:hypothetical protein